MVYRMVFRVDGACRNNGNAWATGAAACVLYYNASGTSNRYTYKTQKLPKRPTPTNQRAEITAVILALEWAISRFDDLEGYPTMDVTIYSDSQYAVSCMNEWSYKWCRNGWVNARGFEVVNRNLIQKACNLEERLNDLGNVRFIWVPRSANSDADELCNEVLDNLQ